MKKFLIITTLVLFSCSYAFAQMEITIDNECVYLDELTARYVPHNKVECGISAGSKVTISKDVIQKHIDEAGINGTVRSDVIVYRQWEKLSYDKVAKLIKDEYEKAHPETEISIEQIRIPDNLYDIDNSNLKISVDTSKLGSAYAEVSRENSKYQIYYYVKGFKTAYITKERVKTGESLAGKITQEKVDVTNIKNQLVTDIESVAAARNMPAGKILTTDLVSEKPALKKGEAVKIIVSNGALYIETQGVVEENALPGKKVLVRNTASQKVITASYVGNGVVKADF